ncbi:MAG: 3-oxoacyl-ACP reductase FabG [Planctomycetes bacterium]|nr:3-oxoacyl-ACP reductase FabG [Planctomycetota bacterium]
MPGIAVVTGASRGIGRACAVALARDGFEVWANYRSRDDEAEKLAEEVRAAGGSCKLLKFDVADRAAAQEALAPLEETPAAVLVNNAGITKDGLFMTMSPDDWSTVLTTNLGAFYNVTRPVLKGMARARAGRIISLASVSGQHGNKGQANYAASKAGIIAASKSLALEYGRWSILVNVVAPGFIETDMVAGLPKGELEKNVPLRRFGRPEEVAGVVSFLASERASYITGAVIDVNGGLYT